MPVLFQFPRPARSSKGRPLPSAMRKSGSRLIGRRSKTVHFATTKTLLSAPRTPPTLPLIPYDDHARGMHTPNASSHTQLDLISYYQPTSSSGSSSRVVHAETVPLEVEWDWDWDVQPSAHGEGDKGAGGSLRRRWREKIPRERMPKTPHPRKGIDFGSPGVSQDASFGSEYFPVVSEGGYAYGGGGGGYASGGYGGAGGGASGNGGGHEERGRERERSRRREMLDRLTGRSRSHSRSHSQQSAPLVYAPPPQALSQSQHAYQYPHSAQPQQQNFNLLQVPARQRHGSFSSDRSHGHGHGHGSTAAREEHLSSSAPSVGYLHAQMTNAAQGQVRPESRSSARGHGHGQLQANYVYPAPASASPTGHGHSHSRSRTTSSSTNPGANVYSYSPQAHHTQAHHQHHQNHQHQQAHQHLQPPQHQMHQTHHRHHSASSYPAPPPNIRRRSNSISGPPSHLQPTDIYKMSHANYSSSNLKAHIYAPSPSVSPTTPHAQAQQVQQVVYTPQSAGAYTPQIRSASPSPYLSVPSREHGYNGSSGHQRQRAGSFSYGARPPPAAVMKTQSQSAATHKASPSNGLGGAYEKHPQMTRRRTASNPHLSSSAARHQSQSQSTTHHQRHQSRPAVPHRYLAASSSSAHPQISWDIRLPPTTATRTRTARGASHAKVHYLSPQALVEPATSPSSAFMRVSAIRVVPSTSGSNSNNKSNKSRREGWPWPIAIYPPAPKDHAQVQGAVTLNDVLHTLYASMRARASEKEYERFLPDRMDKRAVSSAYEGRWREESSSSSSREGDSSKYQGGGRDGNGGGGVGLRRVDFLRGRTVFVGLEPMGGVEGEWCLVVR